MTGPENTSSPDYRDINALGLLAVGSSGWITGQERAGQSQLVNSTSLPTQANDGDAAYLALGFTFGEPRAGDPLFRPATMPEGWRKEASDHSMWSYVVDQLGRRRVSVFYKAAFYDRDAFMRLVTVYGYACELEHDGRLPAYDDAWCSPATFVEAVAQLRAELVEQADQAAKYAAERDDDYWPGREVELRAELVKFDAWAAKVAEAAGR